MARSARRSVSAPVQFIPTVCPVSFPSRISHRTLHGHERRARFFRPSGAGNAEKLRTLGLRASFGSGPPRTPPPRTSRRHTPTKNTMVRHRPREPSSPPRARLDRRAPARSRAPRSRATADVTTARARSRLTSFVAAARRPPPPPPPPHPPSRAPRRTPSSPRPSSPSRRPIPMCTPSCRRRSSARCASSRAPRVLSLPRRRSRRPPPSPKHRATSVAGASVGGEETSRRDRPRSIPRSIAPGLPRALPSRATRLAEEPARPRADPTPPPQDPHHGTPPRRPEPNPPPHADAFSRSVPFPDGSFSFVPAPAARASSSSPARTSRPPP